MAARRRRDFLIVERWVAMVPIILAFLPVSEGHESGNEGYYDGYAQTGIHEEMLKDTARTGAYRDAIIRNRDAFEGAIVVDIGCGTGILSLIAAQAGAKKVYCVEASSLAETTMEIVAANNLSHKITVLNMLAEDVELPEGGCDIIVSEWMGYFLLYENMLSPVLEFRDKWLRNGGLILPSSVKLMSALYSDPQFWNSRVTSWDDVHGFDFSPVKSVLIQEQFLWPERQHLDASNLASGVAEVFSIDAYNATKESLLEIRSALSYRLSRTCSCHGAAFWFEALFELSDGSVVTLDTGPKAGYNHWSQVIWYFEEPIDLDTAETSSAEGHLSMDAGTGGAFNVEFYLTSPTPVYKVAQEQNPDTIYQDIFERLEGEKAFALKQAAETAPDWPQAPGKWGGEVDELLRSSNEKRFSALRQYLQDLYYSKSAWRKAAFLTSMVLFGFIVGRFFAYSRGSRLSRHRKTQ